MAKKTYSFNMDNEKAPSRLLPKGLRELNILSMKESTSKSGNPMFIVEVEDVETGLTQLIYLVNLEGKRWLLKSLLKACYIEKDKDGKYNWSIDDVVNRRVVGEVVHEEEEWIDRDGNNRTSTKSRIIDFKQSEEKAWDE